MKNSAETNPASQQPNLNESNLNESNSSSNESALTNADSTASDSNDRQRSLFPINEHRLSIGLLALLILIALGYGVWMAMSSFLPESTAATTNGVSRKETANAHYEAEEWDDAVSVYLTMLEDDPDNGFATQRLAYSHENQVYKLWLKLREIKKKSENTDLEQEILAEEPQYFQAALQRWNSLLDNSRFARNAYERIASLHSLRAKYIGGPNDADHAVEILDEMFKKGYTTSNTIGLMGAFRPIKSHPQFERLVNEEQMNLHSSKRGMFFRQPGMRR